MEKTFKYILERIFADGNFSRSEREALQKVLVDLNPDDRQLSLLRSQLFSFVREKLAGSASLAAIDVLEEINKLLLPKIEVQDNHISEAYFSPGFSCQKAIIRHIHNAKKSIDICVFTISDNEISDEISRVFKNGINVRILTDNDKRHDTGSDIFKLENEGIPVVTDTTPDHMHHKFAIFDSQTLLLGSYNWTRSAALYNNEDLIVTDEPKLVECFSEEFEKLWLQFSL